MSGESFEQASVRQVVYGSLFNMKYVQATIFILQKGSAIKIILY